MKNVYFIIEMPRNQDYIGGIAVILKQYMGKKDLFLNNGYSVNLLNLADVKSGKGKKAEVINAIKEMHYADKVFQSVTDDSIVHMHSSRKWTLLKNIFTARSIRKNFSGKMILSIHFADIEKILYTNKFLRKFQLYSINKIFDKIIFLSKKTQMEFIQAGIARDKTEVLYTFHGFERMNNCTNITDRTNILFVGSIDKRKGIIDLLDTASKIKDKNFCINVCGQFTDDQIKLKFEEYKEILGEKLIFRGYVSGKEKIDLFNQSDVLVLPSYGEGMPIVIMEAMAAGCAIISTNVGAIPEIITEENGILFNPGDVDALSCALQKVITDKAYLDRLQKNNIVKGQSFNLENNISMLCNIYDR